MANKREPSLDAKVNHLTRLVEKGFAAVAHDIGRLPTHADVRRMIREEVLGIVHAETKGIRDELADIRRDLKELTGKVDNISGLPKEIDHALDRIRRIEKHLGIETDIAA